MTYILGLTGGIGTGKSTVARMFVARGAVLIDADAIVHELQAPGTPLLEEIVAHFGAEVLTAEGALDRAALGARVFADPDARAALGAIVHPPVRREMRRRVEDARARGVPLVVLDIPLLFEGRAASDENPMGIESVALVYAPRELQVERQISRDGAIREEAVRRIDAQMSIEEKRRLADFVIDNSGSLEETEAQVAALIEGLSRGAEDRSGA